MRKRNGNTVSFKDYVDRLDAISLEREERFNKWLEKTDLDRKESAKETAARLEEERKAAAARLEEDRKASEARLAADRREFEARFEAERKEARSLRFHMTLNSIGFGIMLIGILVSIALNAS